MCDAKHGGSIVRLPFASRVKSQWCLVHLRDLFGEAVSDVPEVAAGRCVHERASVATCERCVAACPQDAWHLDDEQLMIDVGQCDGCGLCVAHCPEGVLSQLGVSPESYAGAAEVRLACERVTGTASDWQLRCVHAIGIAWLAALYQAGLRQLVLHVGDCEACDRCTDNGLADSVERLNDVLAQRKLPQIALRSHHDKAEASGPDEGSLRQGGPHLSRRGFLRRMVHATTVPNVDPPEATWKPPGSYLPPARLGDLALFVPEMDVQRCNGCDACLIVCDHSALACKRDPSEAYVISADACTGCGLCVDICDQAAIRVNQGAIVSCMEIPLVVGNCKACGVRFHRPDTGRGADTLCPVCSHVNHKRNLYQVL